MASTPDTHPDGNPTGPSESPEQVSPIDEPGRESVETDLPDSGDVVPDSGDDGTLGRLKGSDQILAFENSLPDYLHEAGVSDGVSGTAGDVKTQDDLAR